MDAADDGSSRAHGIHHCEGVRDPRLEVPRPTVTARAAGAASVVQDHSREPTEVLVHGPLRRVPPFVHDREEVVLPNQVDRPLAEGLVREVRPVLGAGEGDTGAIHPRIVRPVLTRRNSADR